MVVVVSMRTDREEIWPDRSEISAVVQVMVVEMLEISRAMVSIMSDVGSWFTKFTKIIFFVTTEEQVVAEALDDAVDVAKDFVAFLAFSRAAKFFVNDCAFFIISVVLSLQEWIALIASSSYFLHLLNADLHLERPFVTFLDSSSKLQPFTLSNEEARLELSQQEQAAAPGSPMHLVTWSLYKVMVAEHSFHAVMFPG